MEFEHYIDGIGQLLRPQFPMPYMFNYDFIEDPETKPVQSPFKRIKESRDVRNDMNEGYRNPDNKYCEIQTKQAAVFDQRYDGEYHNEVREKIYTLSDKTKIIMMVVYNAVHEDYEEVIPGPLSKDGTIRDVVLVKTIDGKKVSRYVTPAMNASFKDVEVNVHMATEEDLGSSLPRLYFEFQDMKEFLNTIDEHYVLLSGKIVMKGYEDHIEVIEEDDYTFDILEENISTKFKIKKTWVKYLMKFIPNYHIRLGAMKLIDCLAKREPLRRDENTRFYKEEVIDLETKKFQEEFRKGRRKNGYFTSLNAQTLLTFMIDYIDEYEFRKLHPGRTEDIMDREFILDEDFLKDEPEKPSEPIRGIRQFVGEKQFADFLKQIIFISGTPINEMISDRFISMVPVKDLTIVKGDGNRIEWRNEMKKLCDFLTSKSEKRWNVSDLKQMFELNRDGITNYSPEYETFPYYYGRYEILKRIKNVLNNSNKVVLKGMRGSGKTTLFWMHMKTNILNYRGNLLYLRANTKESLLKDFENFMAKHVGTFGIRRAKNMCFDQWVDEIMRYFNGTPWMVLYDDTDEFIYETVEQEGKVNKMSYLPDVFRNSQYPVLVITTAKRNWIGRGEEIIEVPSNYTPEEAWEVLVRNVTFRMNYKKAKRCRTFVEEHHYYPLAIYHIIHYIRRKDQKRKNIQEVYSMEEYEGTVNRKRIAYSKFSPYPILSRYNKPLMKVWDEFLETPVDDKVKELLFTIGFIRDDWIPKDIFKDIMDNDAVKLDSIIDMIHDNYVIELTEARDSLMMHGCIKLVCQFKKQDEGMDVYNAWYDQVQNYITNSSVGLSMVEKMEYQIDEYYEEERKLREDSK